MNSILSFLGLIYRAGRLAVGEEPVGAAARAHKAYLLLLASDAADNTIRRADHFCQAGKTVRLIVPWTRQELGGAVGRTACAMMAVSDIGSAAALAEKLAARDPERFGEARDALVPKAARAKRRRDETRAHKKNVRSGKTSAARREKRKQDTDQ